MTGKSSSVNGARRNHVVEEAVTRVFQQRRADAEFRAGKKIEHGGGEQMRGRMAQDIQAFERLRQHRLNLDGAPSPAVQREGRDQPRAR